MVSSREPRESRQNGNSRSKESRGPKPHPQTSAPGNGSSQQKDVQEPVKPESLRRPRSYGITNSEEASYQFGDEAMAKVTFLTNRKWTRTHTNNPGRAGARSYRVLVSYSCLFAPIRG